MQRALFEGEEYSGIRGWATEGGVFPWGCHLISRFHLPKLRFFLHSVTTVSQALGGQVADSRKPRVASVILF